MLGSAHSFPEERRFVAALRRISSELTLPEPTKSRILLEMAADLESLYQHYRQCGYGEAEALERTEARLLVHPEALRQLVVIHTRPYERILTSVARRARWGFDLLLFLFGVVPLYAGGIAVMSGVGRERIDAFTVLLLLAFVTVALAGVWKGLQLFVSRERRPATLRRGLFPLFIVGMVAPILGVLGGAMSLYRIGSLAAKDALMLDAATLAGDIASAGLQLSLGILIAITAGTLWFVLVLRVASIEQSECAGLLGYPG